MTIVRNEDGTLVVPVRQERHHDEEDEAGAETVAAAETTASFTLERVAMTRRWSSGTFSRTPTASRRCPRRAVAKRPWPSSMQWPSPRSMT